MYIVLYIYIHTISILIQIICILLITVGCLTTFFLMKIKASGTCVCSQSCNHRDSLKLIIHVYSTDDLGCYKGRTHQWSIFRDGYECSGFSGGGVFQVSLYEMKPCSHQPWDWYICIYIYTHRIFTCPTGSFVT